MSAIVTSLPRSRRVLAIRIPGWRDVGRWIADHREGLWITGLIVIAALAHGINMFNFPYWENDEGTYVSQAWAVLTQGRLAPYTYWYDHAPVGWLQIAAWGLLTGGFHTFGTAIESGRVLMLLFQLGSVYLLYRITRNLSGSQLAAGLACLLFSLSAYGIHYHRRILLDNITTFWLLMSLFLLLSRNLSLNRVWLSAIALGVSILSKEPTVFLIPAMAAIVWVRTPGSQRWFAVIGWLTLVGSVVSLYVLLATLNGELFPSGTWLGGNSPHVSLLDALRFQTSRSKDGGALNFQSRFWLSAFDWLRDEPFLTIAGTVCAVVSVFCIRARPLIGLTGALSLSFWTFLGRGGEVIPFYLVPLLPLLALNIALVITLTGEVMLTRLWKRQLADSLARQTFVAVLTGLCALGTLGGYLVGQRHDPWVLWNATPGVGQELAIAWVKQNISTDSKMVIDMYMWLDLHSSADRNKSQMYSNAHSYAHYYWKVERDPEIRDEVFEGDWRNFDYLIVTTQILHDAGREEMELVSAAMDNSYIVARFDTGWPVEIRKVVSDRPIPGRFGQTHVAHEDSVDLAPLIGGSTSNAAPVGLTTISDVEAESPHSLDAIGPAIAVGSSEPTTRAVDDTGAPPRASPYSAQEAQKSPSASAPATSEPVMSASRVPWCTVTEEPRFIVPLESLRQHIGDVMGKAVECAHDNPANGDVLQQTTTGLAYLRSLTGLPTFTDGYRHWGLSIDELVYWEGDSPDPS